MTATVGFVVAVVVIHQSILVEERPLPFRLFSHIAFFFSSLCSKWNPEVVHSLS
jgi:hypothetical protein